MSLQPSVGGGSSPRSNYSGGLRSHRQEGAAVEGVAEVFEHWQAVLAQGRDITADADVTTSAFQSAKAAGNFHPNFHHAEVALGLVVGKGQCEVPQECQNAFIAAFEPIQ